MDSLLDPWYSMEWFTPTVLRGFTWENPLFLYGILGVPLLFIVRWLSRYYFNQKLPVALVKSDLKSSPLNLFRFLPEIILSLVLILILIALARPQRTNEKVEQIGRAHV